MERQFQMAHRVAMPCICVLMGLCIGLGWAWWSRSAIAPVPHTVRLAADTANLQPRMQTHPPAAVHTLYELIAPVSARLQSRARVLLGALLAGAPLLVCAWCIGAACATQRIMRAVTPQPYASQLARSAIGVLLFGAGLLLAAPLALPWMVVAWFICVFLAVLVGMVRAHLPATAG
jgi:hypothetical protein